MSMHIGEKVVTDSVSIGIKLTEALTAAKLINKVEAYEIDTVARYLYDLNQALVHGWSVWPEIQKEPANLDRGRHHWEICYIAHNQRQMFWPGSSVLAKYFGMTEQNRDRSMRKWTFSSGAIGMSRLLDATELFWHRLEQLGGCKSCQMS